MLGRKKTIDDVARLALEKLAAWKAAERATKETKRLAPTREERKKTWRAFVTAAGDRYAAAHGLSAVSSITSGHRTELVGVTGPAIGGGVNRDFEGALAAFAGPLMIESGEQLVNRLPEGMSAAERAKRAKAATDAEVAAEQSLRQVLTVEICDAILGELESRNGAVIALSNQLAEPRRALADLEVRLAEYQGEPHRTGAGIADGERAVTKARREVARISAALEDARAAYRVLAPLREHVDRILAEHERAEAAKGPRHLERQEPEETGPGGVHRYPSKSAFLRTPSEDLRRGEMGALADSVWSGSR